MSREKYIQQQQREDALHPHIKAVHDAVAAWAKQSTNGALVWEVADEHLPGVWFDWDSAHRSVTWWTPTSLIASLQKLVTLTGDATVEEKVKAAAAALVDYREEVDA